MFLALPLSLFLPSSLSLPLSLILKDKPSNTCLDRPGPETPVQRAPPDHRKSKDNKYVYTYMHTYIFAGPTAHWAC